MTEEPLPEYPDVVWLIVSKTTGVWRISVGYRSEADAWKQINTWAAAKHDVSDFEPRSVGIQKWENW